MRHSSRLPIQNIQKFGTLSLIPTVAILFLVALLWLMGALPSLGQTPTEAAIRYVSPAGTGTTCSTAFPCTLQTALDLSNNSDEVRVQGGLYPSVGITPTALIGVDVAVRGGYDSNFTEPPEPQVNVTILDGNNTGRVIEISATANPTIEGFTIRNGFATEGAGIYNISGSPIIRNNNIHDNVADDFGGGIYDGGDALIENNEIFDNSADTRGAGVYIDNSGVSSTLNFNQIYSNTGASVGGGVFLANNSTAILEGNVIAFNSAATGGGVAEFITNVDLTMYSNLLHDNTATTNGGGILIGGTATLWNNTFADNTASNNGGAIYAEGATANLSMNNTIVAFNNANSGTDGVHNDGGIITGGFNNIWDDTTSGVTLTDPVNGNPNFVDLANDNFHIGVGSSALDAGDPATPAGVDLDIDGQDRPYPNGGTIDVGADEQYPLDFTLLPEFQVQLVDRNTTAIYEHTVTNLGNSADTYSFDCTNTDWSISICPADVTIPAGNSQLVQTHVDVPLGATPLDENITTIQATSDLSPTLTRVATVTAVVSPMPGISIEPPYSDSLKPSESVTFTHLLTNTGDTTDTISVELTENPDGWADLIPSNAFQVTLPPDGSIPVRVRVTVGDSAPAGLAHVFEIQATSGFIATVLDTVTDTVTAKATAGTRYVAVTGEDTSNNCLVSNNPCASVSHAVDQASFGDEIHIATGTYNESDINVNANLLFSGGWNGGFGSQQDNPNATIIDAGNVTRIFNVAGSVQPVFDNLTLQNGQSSGPGGAIFVGESAQIEVSRVHFVENQATRGGAVYASGGIGSLVNIYQSVFMSNTASLEGGALYIADGTAFVRQNQFRANSVNAIAELGSGDGGALFAGDGSLFIENNLFVANSSANNGGGLNIVTGNVQLTNNTIVANTASGDGGGFYGNTATVTAINIIFMDNTATDGGAMYNNAGTASLDYSDLLGNSGNETVNVTLGGNNFAADPLFVDDDYRLPAGSPAVDAGDPNTGLDVDFEDDSRPSDQGYDVGYDELVGCLASRDEIIYGSIQDAIDAGGSDTFILVSGICRGVHTYNPGGGDIEQTVHLVEDGLTIQGGWNSDFSSQTGEPTYIHPLGQGRGIYIGGNISATLESLIIFEGNAAGLGGGPTGQNSGGAMYIANGNNITLRQVAFYSSTATLGGGLYVNDGNVTLVGQPENGSFDPVSAPSVLPPIDVGIDLNEWGLGEFGANSATDGAGLYNNQGTVLVDSVILHNNSATLGGGIYNRTGELDAVNVILYENSASNSGGGLYHEGDPNSDFWHMTVYSNTATSNGGGVHLQAFATVRSSLFQGNTATSGSALFSAVNPADIDFNYYFPAGSPVAGTSVGPNSIISNIPPGMQAPEDGDFHLVDDAPAKDQAEDNENILRDADGERRPTDQSHDIGADEIAGCLVEVNGELFGNIQDAMDAAMDGDTINISGTCSGTQEIGGGAGSNFCTDGSAFATVILDRNINLQGGWNDTFTSQNGRSTLDAKGNGHVIYVAPGVTSTVSGFNIINGMVAGGNGGGVCIENASPTLTRNRIYSNTAANGAGVASEDGAPIIDGNRFFNNTANNGGAIYVADGFAEVINNILYGNDANNGGGLFNAAGDTLVWHNNFYDNEAITGGGIYVQDDTPSVHSNLVMSNTATTASGIFGNGTGSADMDYNNFFPDAPNVFGGTITSDGANGISADPDFDQLALYYFTPTLSSPLFDAGDPTALVATDLNGDLRPSHQAPDIGADEIGGCYARILSDPDTIYGSVQLAVDLANNGDTVQVDGVCRGTNEQTLVGPTIVRQTLFVDKNITIDGDWNYLFPMTATIHAGDSGRALFIASGAEVTLMNMTLRNGNGDGAGLLNGGGGVFNTGDLVMENVRIHDSGGASGGGVYNEGDLTIQGAWVYSNTATTGGGVYADAGSTTIMKALFFGNTATDGAGLYKGSSNLLLDSNKFFDNVALGLGGAVYLGSGSTPDLWNNYLYDNEADTGAGIYNTGSSARIYHNTIVDNIASSGDGGGIHTASGNPILYNNLIDNNSGSGVHVIGGSPTVDYNNIVRNTVDYDGISAGGNDISLVPNYVDAVNNDFHLLPGSPGMDNGLEALPVVTDYDGDPRPTNDGPDRGADEIDLCRIRVDTEIFGVLQTAIDYAESNGFDTIEIARGECKGVQTRNGTEQVGYVTEDLNFIGSLRRADFSDPNDFANIGTVSTIINAQGEGRVIYIAGGAEPTFTHVAFVLGDASQANDTNDNGGGVYNPSNSQAFFLGVFICENTAENGGGYYGGASSTGEFTGGTMGDCIVATSVDESVDPPGVTVRLFQSNTATDGAGIYIDSNAEFEIRNYLMDDHVASSDGGAIYNAGLGKIVNLILYNNTATNGNGGGIFTSGDLEIYHSTIRDNFALNGDGGGVYKEGLGTFLVNSNIFFQNEAQDGGGVYAPLADTSNYNNYRDNVPNARGGGLTAGPNDFSVNPGFLGLWTLSLESMSLDRADPALVDAPLMINFDAQNHLRPDGNPDHNLIPKQSDVGADELVKEFGCTVDPDFTTVTAEPGDTIVHSMVISNTGSTWPPPLFEPWYGFTDTITMTLDMATEGWTEVSINGVVTESLAIQLAWRDAVPVVMTVTVPATATYGTQDQSSVRCRSTGEPDRTDVGEHYTNIGLVNDVLVYPDYNDTALPGDVLTFTHYIENVGNQVETYDLFANPGPGGAIARLASLNGVPLTGTITNTAVTLAPNFTATVELEVTILDTAANGDIARPGVIARAQSDPAIFGAAQNNILIGGVMGDRYVATNGSDSENNCTDLLLPCRSVQHAVDQAEDGDVILIEAGVYTDTVTRTVGAELHEQVLFVDKSVTIRGGYSNEFTYYAPLTNVVVLDGELDHRVIMITDSLSVTISSLFISNGVPADFLTALPDEGGGVYNAGSDLSLTAVHFYTNGAQFGGGLYHMTGMLTVNNSVFNRNSNQPNLANDEGEGGAIYIAGGDALLENNTFVGNQANDISSLGASALTTGQGGAIYVHNDASTFTLLNNIFAYNEADDISSAFHVIEATDVISNNFNLFFGNTTNPPGGDVSNVPLGPDSLTGDPDFTDAFFHIGPLSAAKDRGTDQVSIAGGLDYELEPRLQGFTVDIGADERFLRAEFVFTPTMQMALIDPSVVTTYTHWLTNTGDFTDTYNLAMVNESIPPGGGWAYNLSPTTINDLAPGEGQEVTLVVTGSAFPGYMDVTTVTATSGTGASISVVDTTRVRQTPGVDIEPNRNGASMAGEAIVYTHTLTNTGDGVDSFSLALVDDDPAGWTIWLSPTFISLLPSGNSEVVTVTVLVPAGTVSGTLHTAVIEATTVSTPTVSDRVTDTTLVLATSGVLLEPDNTATASVGQIINYTHTLTNLGNLTDTFDLDVASGWSASVMPTSVTLPPLGTQEISVDIIVPSDAGGQSDIATVTATSQGSGVQDTAVNTTTVPLVAGVILEPDNTTVATQGQVVVYTHTVTNIGNATDTFSVTATSTQGWLTALTAGPFVLPLDGMATVLVTVTVPGGALDGSIDTTTVTATSQNNPAVTDSATDVTILPGDGKPGVDIEPDNAMATPPGEVLTYTHVVTNTGTTTDVINLSVDSSQGWGVSVSPNSTLLTAGASSDVTVIVAVPASATDGTVDVTTVTASSTISPTLTDSATDTTTVVVGGGSRDVDIEPDNKNANEPGVTVTYEHWVTNTGTIDDDYTITLLSSEGWAVSANPDTLDLSLGQSAMVEVMVTIPGTATIRVTDVTTVTVTSNSDASIRDSVTDSTLVIEPGSIDVDIEPNNAATAQAGETVMYNHTVTNTGTMSGMFSISVNSSERWSVSVSTDTVDLAPGESVPVVVSVIVPAGFAGSAVDETTVTVASLIAPSITDVATDTTTVHGLLMPIIFNKEGDVIPPTPTPPPPTPTPAPCTPTGVDLVVVDVWVDPNPPPAGSPATVYVTIRNQGSVDVTFGNNFYLDFYVDRVPAPFVVGDYSWGIQGGDMTAGTSKTFSHPYTFSGGSHTLWAQVDTDNTVDECPNESNNIFGPINIDTNGITDIGGEGQQNTPIPQATTDKPRSTPTPQPPEDDNNLGGPPSSGGDIDTPAPTPTPTPGK